MGQGSTSDPVAYLSASSVAAVLNFPLWKAATIGQSGFAHAGDSLRGKMRILFGPPYKGVAATMFGMTWARAAIFYCSDTGKRMLQQHGSSTAVATSLPAVIISTLVQVINQPIVRGTVTLQDPACSHPNLMSALAHIYRERGARGLWHGTSASVAKTVPKYVVAVWVKDMMAEILPPPTVAAGEPGHRGQMLRRAAAKSVAAGVAGAALTNPLDVIRNEMFKTEEGAMTTVRRLMKRDGLSFLHRGMGRNLIAVALPIAMTIFLTDAFTGLREDRRRGAAEDARGPQRASSFR